jgi:hypothetical protein
LLPPIPRGQPDARDPEPDRVEPITAVLAQRAGPFLGYRELRIVAILV